MKELCYIRNDPVSGGAVEIRAQSQGVGAGHGKDVLYMPDQGIGDIPVCTDVIGKKRFMQAEPCQTSPLRQNP